MVRSLQKRINQALQSVRSRLIFSTGRSIMRQLVSALGMAALGLVVVSGCVRNGSVPNTAPGGDAKPPDSAAQPKSKFAHKAEFKGLFVCCGDCAKNAKDALAKVDGIGDVTVDITGRVVTCRANDWEAAYAGYQALMRAGFGPKFETDAKPRELAVMTQRGGYLGGIEAEEISVAGVHCCCPGCEKAIQ